MGLDFNPKGRWDEFVPAAFFVTKYELGNSIIIALLHHNTIKKEVSI